MPLGDHYDAIVVGSGPGGSTVARELSRMGQKVLLLERGQAPALRGTLGQMALMGAVPGRSLQLTNALVPVIRGITLGGSSTLCYATAFDPPLSLFATHGVDLSRELAEMRQELPIAPLADHLVGPLARRLMVAARFGGFNWHKLDKIIDQTACRRGCWRCTYGCPYKAKWSAEQFARQAQAQGAQLVTGARVQRVLRQGNRAVGVEYVIRGRTEQVFADRVVIAAGGLGTPVILKQSGLDGVGQGLFLDPVVAVMGLLPEVSAEPGESPGHEVPMVAGMQSVQDGYMVADMALPASLFRAFTALSGRLDNLLGHGRTAILMVKVRDGLSGSVDGRGRIDKRLSAEDKSKLAAGYDCARAILALSGASSIYKSHCFAAHPGGTVRLGQCLDANLETELRHLYVCDASVIPGEWGLPPVLTLVCLGRRLARHLS